MRVEQRAAMPWTADRSSPISSDEEDGGRAPAKFYIGSSSADDSERADDSEWSAYSDEEFMDWAKSHTNGSRESSPLGVVMGQILVDREVMDASAGADRILKGALGPTFTSVQGSPTDNHQVSLTNFVAALDKPNID